MDGTQHSFRSLGSGTQGISLGSPVFRMTWISWHHPCDVFFKFSSPVEPRTDGVVHVTYPSFEPEETMENSWPMSRTGFLVEVRRNNKRMQGN